MVLQHLTLRFVLYRAGYLPWHCERFCDYAVERAFLRKVGGGYLFFHGELRDHFAQKAWAAPTPRWANVQLVALIVIMLGLTIGLARSFPSWWMRQFAPATLWVNGPVTTNLCGRRGDPVTIESRGFIRVGNVIGVVGVDGTERGLVGYSLGSSFNTVATLPHGALLCRVTGEPTWQLCAGTVAPHPLFAHAKIFQQPTLVNLPLRVANYYLTQNAHRYQFPLPRTGCLEFAINDNELENDAGGFNVGVRLPAQSR